MKRKQLKALRRAKQIAKERNIRARNMPRHAFALPIRSKSYRLHEI